MASFDRFFPLLLHYEGGYCNHPTDPGGETNKGITMAVFRQCSHELLGIEPGSANLRALTDGQAGIIYKTLYWNRIHGDQIESQDLADMVCDFYVNSGTHAISLLQRVMNEMGAHVIEDGVLGPGSLRALGALRQDEVYRRYKQGRIVYYLSLAKRFPEYVKGWLNRVDSFPDPQESPEHAQAETELVHA